MTREDIIRWAREAGFMFCEESHKHQHNCLFYGGYAVDEQLKRFAALVAAAERNKVAQWMMAQGYATGHGDTTEDLLKELEWQIRESEREAIAQSLDKQADLAGDPMNRKWAQEMAAAVRARGQI